MTRIDWLLMAFNVALFGGLLRWLWIKRANALADVRPKCKHGVDKLRGPKCAECRKEDEAYFAEKRKEILREVNRTCLQCGHKQPETQAWLHSHNGEIAKWRPDRVTVNFAIEEEIKFDFQEAVPSYDPDAMLKVLKEMRSKHTIKWGWEPMPVAVPFKVGQWVRVYREKSHFTGALGCVSATYKPDCVTVVFEPNSLGHGFYEHELEPATPRPGEWWMYRDENPGACPGSSGTAGHPILITNPELLCKSAYCQSVLEPVNFGKER
jgi:hypothetical protein